ncbi:MAG: hypothetical protein JSW73_05465 [Candidatus Woesearchaeota archaeon]|nr:MAG: hypothetical protein JSW73_05465 [Candidatus Woesearchaeota archaeon]
MELRQPKSMSELVYFTQRTILPDGKAKVWVFRSECPSCKKGLMGKPIDPKTGKPKTRATEYICPECGYTAEKEEYEDTLTANIEYTCPNCKKQGSTQVPFKRQKITITDPNSGKKSRADAVVFECEHCNFKINITKKMK